MDHPRLLCIAAVVVLHGAAVTWWWQRRSSWRDAAAARPRLGAAARAESSDRYENECTVFLDTFPTAVSMYTIDASPVDVQIVMT